MGIVTKLVVLPDELIEKIKTQILDDGAFDVEHKVQDNIFVNITGFGSCFTSQSYITSHSGSDLYDYDSLITDVTVECISFWNELLEYSVNCSPEVESSIINQIIKEVVS